MDNIQQKSAEHMVQKLKAIVTALQLQGRTDLILHALGVPLLEQLRIEAARGRLKRLLITQAYRFYLLSDDDRREIILQPVHKAVYLLFLAHPEGIEFKQLSNYRNELVEYYQKTARYMDRQQIAESVNRLINPADNAINEKCSRIKRAFLELMDEYQASYYIISSHTTRHIAGSQRIWYERLKVINLPRHLVIYE